MAELTFLLKDEFQRKGIGDDLMKRMITIARQERVGKLVANMLVENKEMQSLCQKLGFEVAPAGDKYARAELKL
jgi:acetyltransferase